MKKFRDNFVLLIKSFFASLLLLLILEFVFRLKSLPTPSRWTWVGNPSAYVLAPLGFWSLFLFAFAFLGSFFGTLVLLLGAIVVLGLVNYQKLHYLGAPLMVSDWFAIAPAWATISEEHPFLAPAFLSVLILVCIYGIIRVWKDCSGAQAVARVLTMAVTAIFLASFYFSSNFWASNFEKWGLFYFSGSPQRNIDSYGVFVTSLLRVGSLRIPTPDNYTSETIKNILKPYDITATKTNSDVNVISFLAESFVDPVDFGLALKKDPIPFFRELKNKSLSGDLIVPVVGSGTCNTEFEILTGLSMKLFPNSQVFPFQQYIHKPIHSLASFYSQRGYSTVGMHPNVGTFWNRQVVFPFLGFKRSIFIDEFPKGPGGWYSDRLLVDTVIKTGFALVSPFFMHVVSVGTHWPNLPTKDFEFRYLETSDEGLVQLETYFQKLYLMDLALRDLINHFSKSNQKTVVVIYGDHFPPFPEAIRNLYKKNVYTTPVLFWSNFREEKGTVSLSAFEVGPKLIELSGLDPDPIWNFVGSRKRTPASDSHWTLQYDQLFGRGYSSSAD